jgi:hypothetical protein
MLAQSFGIAAIPFGFRDRQSLVLARPEQDQNGGREESPGSQACPANKVCDRLEARNHGRFRRYTEGFPSDLDCQLLIVG